MSIGSSQFAHLNGGKNTHVPYVMKTGVNTSKCWPIYIPHIPWCETNIVILGASLAMLWLGHVPWVKLNTFECQPIYIHIIPWWKTDIVILRASLHMLFLGHLMLGDGTGTCALG